MKLISMILTATPYASFINDILNTESTLRSVLDLIVVIITIGGCVVGIPTFVMGIWKRLISPYREYVSFVDRVYSKESRKAVTKYYIPTRAQDIDPCEFEEIRDNNGNFISQQLIPFFISDAFKESSQGKYYLVLADSGMGKTTFMLRLYRECLLNRKLRKRYTTKLIPLSQSNCIQAIEKIENPENTILLLDALDENGSAINDYESFFTTLLQATEGFNKTVITCRTQFFPDRATEPVETGRIRIGTGNKKEEITKKYISPFSDEEVKLYLKKQYRFNKKKQRQAYEIVTKVPVLMARPVILNWINFLCDSTEKFTYAYQIYSAIIDKWIERESIGHTSRSLFELSRAIANYMYLHNTTSMSAEKVEEIASKKNIQLEPIIAKSRSLLNRNGNGEYKFAHRSFLEYFIVFSLFERMKIPANLAYLFSLSGVKRFFFEILLDAAQQTNPETYQRSINFFNMLKPYIHMDSLLDIVNHKNVTYSSHNSENGFTIHASLPIKESEMYDPQHVLYVSDQTFADLSKPGTIAFKRQTISLVELTISTAVSSTRYPDTILKVSSNISQKKK